MKKLLLISIILFSIVKVEAQSIGGVSTGSNTFCDTINSGFISVTAYVGTVTKWLYSTDGGINWTGNSNTFSSQAYYNLNKNICYKAVIKNGAFPPDTSTVACITIKFLSLTKGPDLTLNCTTSDGTINVSTATPGVTYSWTPVVVSGGNTNTAFVNSAGNYSCIATETISGCTNRAVISVLSNTMMPSISAMSSDNITCTNSTVTLIGNSPGNIILWNGPLLVNATNPTEVTIAGVYTATAIDAINGCIAEAMLMVSDICESTSLIESHNDNLIFINPNPTNGLLTITSKTELQKIEVMTITGQVLMSEIPNGNSHLLHLDNFANGIYFVNLFQNNRIIKREKVIVNK